MYVIMYVCMKNIVVIAKLTELWGLGLGQGESKTMKNYVTRRDFEVWILHALCPLLTFHLTDTLSAAIFNLSKSLLHLHSLTHRAPEIHPELSISSLLPHFRILFIDCLLKDSVCFATFSIPRLPPQHWRVPPPPPRLAWSVRSNPHHPHEPWTSSLHVPAFTSYKIETIAYQRWIHDYLCALMGGGVTYLQEEDHCLGF